MLASNLRKPTEASTRSIASSGDYSETALTSSAEQGPEVFKVLLVLTPEEIRLLRQSWSQSVTASEEPIAQDTIARPSSTMFASTQFWNQVYESILELFPELERIMPSVEHQTTSFAGIVYTAINNLENLTVMEEYLGNLGRRHGRVFNIKPVYFHALGVALIDTFENRNGTIFTEEISIIWARLYCFLANSMIQASHHDPVLSQDMLVFPRFLRSVPVKIEPVADTLSIEDLTLKSHSKTNPDLSSIYQKRTIGAFNRLFRSKGTA